MAYQRMHVLTYRRARPGDLLGPIPYPESPTPPFCGLAATIHLVLRGGKMRPGRVARVYPDRMEYYVEVTE